MDFLPSTVSTTPVEPWEHCFWSHSWDWRTHACPDCHESIASWMVSGSYCFPFVGGYRAHSTPPCTSPNDPSYLT